MIHPKTLAVAAGLAFTGLPGLGSASAGTFCEAKAEPLNRQIDAKIQPVMVEIDSGIAEARKAGRDPNNVVLKLPDGSYKSLSELRDILLAQKTAAQAEVAKAIANCDKNLKPYQDATDAFVDIATGGLSKLLPPSMTHIDIGEILAGKPFGGDGALIPHLRERLLSALGLANDRGEIVKFLRDPVGSFRGIFR